MLSLPAAAQAVEAHANPGLVVGAKFGGSTGSFLNDSGLSYVTEVELGYLLPLPNPIRHALEVFGAAAYAAPDYDGRISSADGRLPGGGRAQYTIDSQVLTLTFGVLGRLPLASKVFAPYLALGYRGYAVSNKTSGSVAMHTFGSNTERGFAHGFHAAIGVDAFVGPGALLAELQFGIARHDSFVLRDTSLGALQLLLGYRLMFGASAKSEPAHNAHEPPTTPEREPPKSADTPPPESDATSAAPASDQKAAQEADPSDDSQAHAGQIRGQVRSQTGEPVAASVVIQPEDIHLETDPAGAFRVDVTPGKHTVQLRARGYRSQRRDVLVDERGITVLNVELIKR